MRYCQDCGEGHDCSGTVAPGPSDAVRIAEIERDRDIKLAQLSARAARDELATDEAIAETYAEADVAAAVAEAEVIGAAVEASMDAGTDPAPVIVDAPEVDDDGQDDELAPPAASDAGSPIPEPRTSRRGLGMW